MKRKIIKHLLENPSYFKWGEERLSRKYGCSVRTIRDIIRDLQEHKKRYLRSL